MPGSTPIRFPINTPKTDHSRLLGCSATLKPIHRSIKVWCMVSTPGEEWQLQVQALL